MTPPHFTKEQLAEMRIRQVIHGLQLMIDHYGDERVSWLACRIMTADPEDVLHVVHGVEPTDMIEF